MKPFAESSEQNKHVILEVLKQEFSNSSTALEIGSGTGQHAVFFAEHLPHLQWYATDLMANLDGIAMWLADYRGDNLHGPLALDVSQPHWPLSEVGAIFSANTAHIMHWPSVKAMFSGVGRILLPGGSFCLYGPFNYHGAFTSDSNQSFDQWLKAQDPGRGIRDIDDLLQEADQAGLQLRQDHAMPVNNRILVWEKRV